MRNLITITILIFSSHSFAEMKTFVQSMTSQQMIQAGKVSYLNRCAGCHGVNADGKGESAPMLDVKPRNLREDPFKLRSTRYGTLPTVSDLLRTINQGIPGSSMPGFWMVSEREKLALVAYIRSLRPEFKETEKEQLSLPIPLPPEEMFSKKATLINAAVRGKQIYKKQQCQMCHGESGLGDGPSAPGLVDVNNRPIKPANLWARTFKSGPTANDIYKALVTGIDGTPMPAYEDTLTSQERWDLVAYIFYLRGRGMGIYSEEDFPS